MTKDHFTPTMRAAIDHALLHGNGIPERTVLVRFPGGFWSHAGWLHDGPHWGTTTIEGIVRRGAGEYSGWQNRKDGSKFPIEMRVAL